MKTPLVRSSARSAPPKVLRLLALLALSASLASGCSDSSDAPPTDPSAVGARVQEILANPDPLARMAELAPMFRNLPPEALPEVRQAYERSGLDGGDPELVLLGLWWARFDPLAAAQWTRTDWRAEYGAVLQAVFRSWAHSDPEAAFAAAQGQYLPAQRDLCIDAAVSGWDESGKPGLVERVLSIPGTERQRVSELLARRRVVSHGAEAALAWAEQIEPPAFADMMALRVASAAALAEPNVAARWAEPRIRDETNKRPTGLPRRIGTRWVRHDPDAAMAWLESLPEGKDREDGVTETYRDWLRRDPDAALAWIEAQEMERWSEPAFYVYGRAMATQKPKRMLEIAERFSDDDLKESSQIYVLRAWIRTDPEAAEAWIAEESTMPEGWVDRARLLRRLPPGTTVEREPATLLQSAP